MERPGGLDFCPENKCLPAQVATCQSLSTGQELLHGGPRAGGRASVTLLPQHRAHSHGPLAWLVSGSPGGFTDLRGRESTEEDAPSGEAALAHGPPVTWVPQRMAVCLVKEPAPVSPDLGFLCEL